MFEELRERRTAVRNNIAKSLGVDIEKGKWNVGDTFTRHGITYKCTGFSQSTGRPTWSKVDSNVKTEKKENQEVKNISELKVGDEVTIVTDNNGDIKKKKGKITKVTSSAYEIDGDSSLRFQRRTGNHVGMDNVKILIS